MSYLPSKPSKQVHVADVFRLMPDRAKLLLALHEDVMRGPSRLSPAIREALFAFCSALNGCEYCRKSHLHAANLLGIDSSQLEELVSDPNTGSAEEAMKPIFRFAGKLTRTPNRIAQSDVDAILACGWDEQTLLDVVLLCGLSNLMNRLVDGTGVDLGDDTGLLGGKQLVRLSYGGIAGKLFGAEWRKSLAS